jgi:hypothetical protein
MKKIACAIIGLVGVFCAAPSFADDRDFELTNATGYSIREIYIDEASSKNWSENELDSVLKDGESMQFKFGKSDRGCKWDMKVVWTDDTSSVWSNLDLCTIEFIKLKYNRKTDEATAEVK